MGRGLAVLCISLLAVLALAGCASSSSSSSSTSAAGTAAASSSAATGAAASTTKSGTSGSPSSSGSGSSSSGAAANTPPVIRTFGANVTSGGAPLQVAFTLNATDADKDALSFVLSFGDKTANSTGKFPSAAIAHTFATAGNYTARLTVTDGQAKVNKTLLIGVVAAAAGAVASGPQTVTGAWTAAGVAGCSEFIPQIWFIGSVPTFVGGPGVGYQSTPLEGKEWNLITFEPRTYGGTFTLKATQTTPPDPSGMGAYGFVLTQFDKSGVFVDDYFDDGHGNIVGSIDNGATFGVLFPCLTGPGDFTYVGTPA